MNTRPPYLAIMIAAAIGAAMIADAYGGVQNLRMRRRLYDAGWLPLVLPP